MELQTYLAILWRRKWVIAITVAATLGAVVIGTLVATPIYQATATLRILTPAQGAVDQPRYDVSYADRLVNTYSELITSRPVLDELVERLGLDEPPLIAVEVVPGSELMRVTVEDANPVLASEAANALIDILVTQNQALYTSGVKTAQAILSEQLLQVEDELSQALQEYESLVAESPEEVEGISAAARIVELKEEVYIALLRQYEQALAGEAIRANTLSVVEPAIVPQRPVKPRRIMNIALGLVVGMAGGVGLAFLLENLDTRLHTVEQIKEVTDLPAVGTIPRMRRRQLSVFLDGDCPQREAFRQLRTNIYATAQWGGLQTIVVTSAEPHEGKSTIVSNLAAAMAQTGHRVIAVDGDLRRPALHVNFGLSNRVGLTAVLKGSFSLQEAVQETEISGVSVLTSGPLLSNPSELLASPRMKALLDEMRKHFDMVLIDAPAFLPVTDVAVLAPMVDGVLLVVRCAYVGGAAVRSACRGLTEIGARLIGLVVNRANGGSGSRYHNYAYYRIPDAAPKGDALTKIDGIGPKYEKALNAIGILSFAQLAGQDPGTLEERMGARVTADRIRREHWIEQAQALVDSKPNPDA